MPSIHHQVWVKIGLIYSPKGEHGFDQSHCHKPTPLVLDDKMICLYFGTFDDSGVKGSSVLRVGPLVYMYFIGWNPSTTVLTRKAIGLAVSEDGGWTLNAFMTVPFWSAQKTSLTTQGQSM